jgi:muconate cycloisomerase
MDVLGQPLPADRMHLMRELRKSVRIPFAVDESSVSPADFFAHAVEGLVDYLLIKVTRSGGVWPTLAQISVAEAAGLPLLALDYRVVLCDGAWSRAQIEDYVGGIHTHSGKES